MSDKSGVQVTAPSSKGERRAPNPEIQALARIDRMLADLDGEAQNRVATWLFFRYCPGIARKMTEKDGGE